MSAVTNKQKIPTFIDLFAGCGGLSLGLMRAGWQGIFAIERNEHAFETLRHNLVDGTPPIDAPPRFNWPGWLDKRAYDINDFIESHTSQLQSLKGRVTLVAGGPPCQGFSMAGKRREDDPRNQLFRLHMSLVKSLQPDFVLLENVVGISTVFGAKNAAGKKKARGRPRESYAKRIKRSLDGLGYEVNQDIVHACEFGVPQWRPRYFTVAVRRDLLGSELVWDFFRNLTEMREDFLESKSLPQEHVTVAQAISDLRIGRSKLIPCVDPRSPRGFVEVPYRGPSTNYQKLMNAGTTACQLDSMRLPRHSPVVRNRFEQIQLQCRPGVQVPAHVRAELGTRKQSLTPLAPGQPAHTVTTLPDDLIHYAEPRIHSVRENARLQSFPDWFEFRGKFTTGGKLRRIECPRYTQVGNAVPPLVAEAVGNALLAQWKKLSG